MGYTDGKLLGFDEGINLRSTDGKLVVFMLGNINGITLGIGVRTYMGSFYESFDGYNDFKLE